MDQPMKIDPVKLRKLRDARAWSQEHLASVAGLSVRTVQRIEAEGSASAESRLALAAALDVAPGDLHAPEEAASAPQPASPAKHQMRGWPLHLALYLVAAAVLIALKLALTGSLGWAIFPLLGWGLGVLLHYRHRRRRAGLTAVTG
jgi:transcriptional regulator with XRE-family HTH domain